MTIKEMQKGYIEKEFTVEEVIKKYIDKIKIEDKKINAFLTLNEDEALKKARKIDEKIKSGEKLGKLFGVPIAIKDNISTKNLKTTCASKMLEDYKPPYDATIIKKIIKEDGIIIGKTNMDEFAMGSSTETSAFKTTKNPRDLTKVPGGSSGGSAAAVAADFAPVSIGSDTGGSIRQPASFCGVFGIKPTYGLVSRYGLIAFASSLDQIGPMAKSVEDCATLLSSIEGVDEMDSTTIETKKADYLKEMKKDISGMKIAFPKEFLKEGLDKEIKEKIYEVIGILKEKGAIVEEIELPIVEDGLSAYYIVSSAEASSNLSRFDGIRYGHRSEKGEGIDEIIENSRSEAFGDEVKRRIMLGNFVLSSGYYDDYYNKAIKFKNKIKEEFKKVYEEYDLIISPTSPILPFDIGDKISDPLKMYLADIYTININIAGVPAISVPCGLSKDKLPIGIQFIASHFEEKKLFNVAYQLEKEFKTKGVM